MGCCLSLPLTRAREFLVSNENLNIYFDHEDVVFEPRQIKKPIGVCIYPGALCDSRAYAELAFEIAKNGYFTIVCKMPLNLSSFAPNKALEIEKRYSSKVKKWVIGGHSLGGIMSGQFLYKNNKSIDGSNNFVGFFLWASRGYYKHDISNLDIPVLVIYSDLDNIIKKDSIEESFKYLPQKNQTIKLIEGGNHTYFGDFPVQRFCCLKDNESTITKEEQIQIIIKETLNFLNKF